MNGCAQNESPEEPLRYGCSFMNVSSLTRTLLLDMAVREAAITAAGFVCRISLLVKRAQAYQGASRRSLKTASFRASGIRLPFGK
jgi:hypothetical protein